MPMQCPNCLSDVADTENCPSCGAVPATESGVQVEPAQTHSAAENSKADRHAAPSLPAPYAIFVALVLSLSLCLAFLAFRVADDVAHGYLHLFPVAIITAVLAAGFMIPMPWIWNKIESRDQNTAVQKRVLVLSIVILLLFVVVSAVTGEAIGATGSEESQLLADLAERRQLGRDITQARNSMQGSTPSQIAVYKELGAGVERFDEVLHRLELELSIYDRKFPAQHANTFATLRWVKTDLKRNDLLKQEIQVATDLEYLGTATQEQLWKERMQPLLDEEAEYVPSKY